MPPGSLNDPGHRAILANRFFLRLREHRGIEVQCDLALLRHVTVPMTGCEGRALATNLRLAGQEELEVQAEDPVVGQLKVVSIRHAVAIDVAPGSVVLVKKIS